MTAPACLGFKVRHGINHEPLCNDACTALLRDTRQWHAFAQYVPSHACVRIGLIQDRHRVASATSSLIPAC